MLKTDLGTSKHVSCAVKRHQNCPDSPLFPVADCVQPDSTPKPFAQDRFTGVDGEILTAPSPGMVGMGVGNQSPAYRSNRIDPGFCRVAVEPFRSAFNQRLISSIR